MKVTTLYWQPAKGNEELILPETKVTTAKVVLPRSNQPYQPNVSTNDSGQYFMPTGYRSLGITIENGDDIVDDVVMTINGKGNETNDEYLFPTINVSETITITNGDGYKESETLFSQITSFSFNKGFPDTVRIKVGLGRQGVITHYMDTNITPPMDYSVQIYNINDEATDFKFQLFGSLLNTYDITSQSYSTFQNFPYGIVGFPIMAPVTNANFLTTSKNMVGINNTTNYGAFSPLTLMWLSILDQTTGEDAGMGSLYFSVLQQGTRS